MLLFLYRMLALQKLTPVFRVMASKGVLQVAFPLIGLYLWDLCVYRAGVVLF
jgi:hypothetical protein